MDRGLLFELDTEFHWTYVEVAGGPRLLALHEAIKPQAERYVRLYTSALWGEVSTSVREHAVIIAAIDEVDEVTPERTIQENHRDYGTRQRRHIDTIVDVGR